MTDPAIAAVEQKLEEVTAKLKKCTDPRIRRNLLVEMRTLIAELNTLVLDRTPSAGH
jgi:metal-sulfur cluster biosynthetic enzyme